MQYPMIAQPQYAFAPTMMAEGGSVAQNLASKGRNGDSMLVHMTPGEVGGLQALAMQHGGSLTINPQTGLPEANFLKNLLPTLLGVGLSFIPGVGPLAAGLTVGGIETVRTGDIGKGFLAGLGAYGGASMAGGLQSAGTAANAANATKTATTATNTLGAADVASAGLGDTGVATQTLGAGSTFQPLVQTPSPTMLGAGSNVGEAAATALTPTQQLTTGFKSVFDTGPTGQAARDAFMGKVGGYKGLATTAGMAGAPMIADALMPKPYEAPVPEKEESNYEGPYKPSERRVSYPTDDERRRRTSEFTYFTPSNPIPFAEGGESKADVVVSPTEAKVYQDILNIQRLAGLPAIDPKRFAVLPSKGYERFVYNPIEASASTTGSTGEKDYGIKALLSKEQIEAAEAAKKAEEEKAKRLKEGGDDGYVNLFGMPMLRTRTTNIGGDSYARGGSVPQLEDGGFVLTKKAVDGLGRGSNKKGQKVASRGLGAIPIKGPGTGTSDSIPTTIDGKRPALISNGEAYVPKKQVAKKGGAKAFYALMNKAEKAAEKRNRA